MEQTKIPASVVAKYREYDKITKSLRRMKGKDWMNDLPEEMGPFLLKMHQLGQMIWMAEHPHHDPPLVVIIPDPPPQKGPTTNLDRMLARLKAH